MDASALHRRERLGPAQLVSRLLGVQAQELRSARLSLRARAEGLTAAAVDAALTGERSLVIAWLQRGTLHLVAREDLAWLLGLTAPAGLATTRRRLGQEGVSPAGAERRRARGRARRRTPRPGAGRAGSSLPHRPRPGHGRRPAPPRLLPAFDPYLPGWADRGFAVPAAQAVRVHPGGGILRPTATVGGLVVATWTPGAIDPFDRLPPRVADALEAERQDVERFTAAAACGAASPRCRRRRARSRRRS